MFTGIVECTGKVKSITKEEQNLIFLIESEISEELKIDQSVSHNGVCLTVTDLNDNWHSVTAIDETLQKTNLGELKVGSVVNLERCLAANARFDGHIVQGHVDQTAICKNIQDEKGSWRFTFEYDASTGNMNVEKGSVCVNGVSLTVISAQKNTFEVAIIPYTYEHTSFQDIKIGTVVNLEFDIVGKYIKKMFEAYR